MKTKLALLAFVFIGSTCFSEDTKFIQVKRDKDNNPISLETAVVSYEKTLNPRESDTVKVDLVGAIHIADHDYYDGLNKDMTKYDALLYELVAEKGTKVEKGQERKGNILSIIQSMMGNFLGLEHQVSTNENEGIDYEHPKNFVHADMSPTDLQKAMAKNGDNKTTMMIDTLLEQMRKRNKALNNGENAEQGEMNDMFSVLTDPQGPLKMKRMMANQFDKSNGEELGTLMNHYIVEERNDAALKVFDAQMEKGKRNMGIFYGAAHMPNLEKKLLAKGFKKTSTKWNVAWDLKKNNSNPLQELLKAFGE